MHGHISLYADDTSLFYFGSSINDLIPQAQSDLNKLFTWFQHNLLSVNTAKTCYTIFRARNKIITSHDQLKINNVAILEKKNETYLGLHMDSYLTWNAHIEYIKSKLSSLTGSLRNIVRCIPRQVRYTIYNCLVKPHLMYLIEIWGSATKTKLGELQTIQNKIIKLLFRYPYLTPTTQIYKETKLLNIKQLYIYSTCILVRKILKNQIHTNLAFAKQREITKRNTRRASFLVLPKPRTKNYGKKIFTYEGAQYYNKIPSNIKNVNSFNAFKTKLSAYVADNYF